MKGDGKKRKRQSNSEVEDMTEKLVGKLHHHAREVRKAAKKAKTFELQKIVKKLKGLRSKSAGSPEIADLEAQLEILKKCDHEPFANTALKTKISKDKTLSQDEHLKAAVARELAANLVVPAALHSNEAKVHGRILSSKIVATEVASVIDALKVALSPDLKKARAAAEESGNEVVESESLIRPGKKAKVAKERPAEPVESDNDEDDQDDASPRVGEFNSDEAIDDGGWESGSVHEGQDDGSDGEDEGSGENQSSEEDTDADEISSRNSPRASERTASTKTKNLTEVTIRGQSTFLPSLSVGFTKGDSDASDFSDGGGADVAPKKNRRGQRARQAIWEKKYGRHANHVKKQQQENSARGPQDKGKGTVRPRPDKAQDKHRTRQAPDPSRTSQPPARPPPSAVRTDDQPLHPSWEAKKRMKEKQNAGIVAPQGKKTVF